MEINQIRNNCSQNHSSTNTQFFYKKVFVNICVAKYEYSYITVDLSERSDILKYTKYINLKLKLRDYKGHIL